MADISNYRALNNLVSDDKRAIEARLGIQKAIEGVEYLRFVSGLLGLPDIRLESTQDFNEYVKTLTDNIIGAINELGKSPTPHRLSSQVRDNDN